jgi:WhiB family transcriptional regulator, redox-sensing transcriptional regulator
MSFQFKPEPWTEFANCQNVHDPEIFFPQSAFPQLASLREPLAICATCKVTAECLDYGKRIQATGVWGGKYLSGYERKTTP